MLIIRRSKLYYTASGIITPLGGRPPAHLGIKQTYYKTGIWALSWLITKIVFHVVTSCLFKITFIIARSTVKRFLPLRFCGRNFVCFSYLTCRPRTISRALCLISSVLYTYKPSNLYIAFDFVWVCSCGLEIYSIFFGVLNLKPQNHMNSLRIRILNCVETWKCVPIIFLEINSPSSQVQRSSREKNRLVITFLPVSY